MFSRLYFASLGVGSDDILSWKVAEHNFVKAASRHKLRAGGAEFCAGLQTLNTGIENSEQEQSNTIGCTGVSKYYWVLG